MTANTVLADLRKRLSVIQEAYVLTIPPPPVQGIGNAGGFKMMLEDRAGLGSEALVESGAARWSPRPTRIPSFAGVFTLFNTGSPSVYADIDRLKAEKVGLTPTDVFNTLQVYLGSQYVNDFNYPGPHLPGDRAGRRPVPPRQPGPDAPEGAQRRRRDGADRHGGATEGHERSRTACRATISIPPPRCRVSRRQASPPAPRCTGWRSWRARCCRPASASNGPSSPSSSNSRARRRCWCSARPPCSCSSCWPRKYESWKLPLAVVLIVPMCLLASVTGLLFRGMPIDILAQIGFVVLVGLAAKNAILIVEFARQAQEDGSTRGGSRGQRGAHAAAADPDDVARLHPRRRAAGGGDRRGRGDAPIARHRRVLRHARRDRLRPALHAGLLHARAADEVWWTTGIRRRTWGHEASAG